MEVLAAFFAFMIPAGVMNLTNYIVFQRFQCADKYKIMRDILMGITTVINIPFAIYGAMHICGVS